MERRREWPSQRVFPLIATSVTRVVRCKPRVSPMTKLVVTLLLIPLIIVMAVKYPQDAGHIVQVVITEGAKLLDFVARSLHDLFSHH